MDRLILILKWVHTIQRKINLQRENKSSHYEFHSKENLIQSMTTENKPYNSSSDKKNHEKINIINQNSNILRRQYSNKSLITKQKTIVESDCSENKKRNTYKTNSIISN